MIWRSSRSAARALICWLALCAAALAQVDVRLPSAKLLDVTPGKIVTASVVVANRGPDADEFREELTLPPGCVRVAPPELPFRLEAGGQTVRILAVQIPATMPSGQFQLRYTVQGRRNPSALDSEDLAIQVLPVDNLELVVEPRTEPVIAGDNYPIRVRVTNHGNRRLPVQLSARSSLKYRVTGGVPGFVLEPGATRELLFRVETDKALAQRSSHSVSFQARAVTAPGKELVQSQASVISIIPVTSGDRDPFHRIPMQLKLSVLGETDHEVQFQAELSGAGSLDEAGRHRIDFLFRGPDAQSANLFGERDEYGASYHGEKWDVSLGDRVYSLSPLLEKHSFGRGAGVTYHQGSTAAGAFYMTTLRRQKNLQEAGAFVRQQFGGFSVQGSFLRKWGGEALFSARALPQNILSLETRYQRGKELDLRLEYGVSRSDSGRHDFGFRAEARGELFGKVSYAVEHVYAGPDFHGYDNDTRSTYATVVVPLSKKFRVRASLNNYSGNLELNPERSTVVNRENSWSAGMAYTLGTKTDVSLDAQQTERNDILLPAAYDFTETSARLGVGHNFGKVRMQSFLDMGTFDNRLTGESGPFQRYSSFVSYQPTSRQSYSAFATYGPSAFTGKNDKSLNVGGSANWRFKDNLNANVSYARNQYDSLEGREQDQAMASVRYRLANKDEIAVVGRWTHMSEREDDEAAVMLTYTRPLSVAVSRKTSIGSLRGRLAHEGVGIARAVITVGDAYAVTDSAGGFEFPSLKPGACELRVVTDSLSPSLVVSTPLPMKLKIRSAETTNVELRAVKASTVAVRLMVYEFASKSITATDVKASGGLDAGTVELTNGHDVLRAQTDRRGEVSFERVPCGRWTLRVRDERIPAQHIIEQAEQELDLQTGVTKNIEVRVLPRRRTMKMIDQGVVRR
jgi:hypothetical protein